MLKRKATQRVLALAVLGAALLISLYWVAPAVLALVRGPIYFDPLDENENDISSLEGQYLETDITTLLDFYAQTIDSSSEESTPRSREYLMPVNDVSDAENYIYIGVEVPRAKIDDADAVMDDTQRLLTDTDGSYSWDGSYVTIRGTLRPMDDETAGLYREYLLSGDDITEEEIGQESGMFRTLVLVDGAIGAFNGRNSVILVGVLWLCWALLWLRLLFIVLTDRKAAAESAEDALES